MRCSDGLYLLLFACQCGPSWGHPSRRMILPFVNMPRMARSDSVHYFLFLQGVSQHLGCLLFLDSQSCPIWISAWGVCAWGSFWGWISIIFSHTKDAEVSFPPFLFHGLHSCLWVDLFLQSCLASFFRILIVPKRFNVFSGIQNLGRTAPCLQSMYWELFSLTSCLVIKQQIRSIGISSHIYYGITFVDVFPLHSVEEERIK